jgi:uncharacterized membrane protein
VLREIALLLHLAAVVIWIGGMFFAHVCLRPAAATLLPPAQRLPLMSEVLGRFFGAVVWSLVLLWGSGLAMFVAWASSGARPPLSWNLMAGLAVIMTLLFALILFRLHPRMKRAVTEGELPQAAAALDGIRRLVTVNLVLGFATIAVATVGRLAN